MINLQVIDGGLEPDQYEIELRQALRKALEQHGAALDVRDRAKAVVDAALQHLAAMDAELRGFDKLDGEIAHNRADAITKALAAGDAMPTLEMPPELHELVLRRADAFNRQTALTTAMERLRANLDEADATLRARQAAVDQAALKIVGHAADARARELKQIEETAAMLRRQLLGATVMRPPGQQIPLNADTMKLLRDDSASALVSKNDTSMGALWGGLFTRLSRGDWEATLDE
jgi:hypothetical protein